MFFYNLSFWDQTIKCHIKRRPFRALQIYLCHLYPVTFSFLDQYQHDKPKICSYFQTLSIRFSWGLEPFAFEMIFLEILYKISYLKTLTKRQTIKRFHKFFIYFIVIFNRTFFFESEIFCHVSALVISPKEKNSVRVICFESIKIKYNFTRKTASQ